MKDLRWIDRDPRGESLACALQSLLAPRGIGATYESLVVALGLGTLVHFDLEQSPAAVGEFARDGRLGPAADAFGVRLRELHPISAAQRLESSAEFEQHFIDSYVPLIRRAFEAGQVALAWHGWPAPAKARWGVLLEGMGASEIRGVSRGGSVEPFTGPAHQVYIVEEIRADAAPPAADAIFDLAAAAMHAQWSGRWSGVESQVTGRRAFDALRDWLADSDDPDAAAVLVSIRERRRVLLTWLTGQLATGGLSRAAAPAWRDSLAASVERLEIASMPGIRPRDLAAVIDQVRRGDEALPETFAADGRSA